MSMVKRVTKWGGCFVLFYMFVYDCAWLALSPVFEDSRLSWVAFQGKRLLDLPGTALFVRQYDLGEWYNVSPNVRACYLLGAGSAVAFVIGGLAGLLAGPLLRRRGAVVDGAAPSQPESVSAPPNGLAACSLLFALAGGLFYGFAFGLIAVVLGAVASRQASGRPSLADSRLAILGQVIGAMDVIVWTCLLNFGVV